MNGLITLNDLNSKFKAAGQHTLIVDNTRTPITAVTTVVRLIAGYSPKGNWNTPILLRRGEFAKAIALYGDIDKKMERKGSFFQRSILTALQEGDVLALNLLKSNDSVDTNGIPLFSSDIADYKAFSTETEKVNSLVQPNALYAAFFNKERFWSPEQESLVELTQGDNAQSSSIFSFVNLGLKDVTVIAKKSTQAEAYNVPVADWYGDKDIPSYIIGSDLISDYFVDVIMIGGNFSDIDALRSDSRFAEYFDSEGLIKSKLSEFLALPDTPLLGYYTGSLIPDLIDRNGNSLNVVNVVNFDYATTGMICAIDAEKLDEYDLENSNSRTIDLIGSSMVDGSIPKKYSFLSYNALVDRNLAVDVQETTTTSTINTDSDITVLESLRSSRVVISKDSALFDSYGDSIEVGFKIKSTLTAAGAEITGETTGDTLYSLITSIVKNEDSVVIVATNNLKQTETDITGRLTEIDVDGNTIVVRQEDALIPIENPAGGLTVGSNHPLITENKIQDLNTKFSMVTAGGTIYGKVEVSKGYAETSYAIKFASDEARENLVDIPDANVSLNTLGYVVGGSSYNLIIEGEDAVGRIEVNTSGKVTKAEFDRVGLSKDFRFVALDKDGNKVLVKSTTTPVDSNGLYTINASLDLLVGSYEGGNESQAYTYILEPEVFAKNLLPVLFKGFKTKASHSPNGTNERVREIYSVMTEGNISKALVDPDFVNWRYFVDTFSQGLEPSAKSYLTRLLKRKQRCIGFLNLPSAKDFRKSTSVRFTDAPSAVNPTPSLSIEHLSTGGNLNTPYQFLFSLPSENDGASFTGWCFPNIMVRDSSGVIDSVPPAALVSNAFMRKWLNNTPFIAVAGTDQGELSGDGVIRPEISLDKEDRAYLTGTGINPIVLKNNAVVLYGNDTGYQKFESILNNLHARDTLITMEIDVQSILQPYEFKTGIFSDETQRTLIETSLNNYLKNLRDSSGAIVDYELIFDRTNNPDFVVNNRAAIVDIEIEIPNVTTRFISRISLTRSGAGVSVGAFQAV